jgi:transposase
MVGERFAPGASVSKVAQRYSVNANLLFTWRRRDARSAASGGVEAVELLPVRVEDERAFDAPVAAPRPVSRIEIVLPTGNRSLSRRTDPVALARGSTRLRRDDSHPGGRSGAVCDRHTDMRKRFYGFALIVQRRRRAIRIGPICSSLAVPAAIVPEAYASHLITNGATGDWRS